jgi:anti-anti-sigma regulatory factor
MSTPSARLTVFVAGKLACVKIVGRANFTSSIEFKTLINELMDQGYTCFVLDLAECVLMDSTFLGVLAGFGLRTAGGNNAAGAKSGIELLNPSTRISELLENLGVLHLFKLADACSPLPEELKVVATKEAEAPTREDVTRNCLEAHRTLMDVCAANIPRFKDVAQFLAEDLKKSKSGA